MIKLNKWTLPLVLTLMPLAHAMAQTVDMEVKQGPNIDVVLTVGITDQNIDTFEADLDAALQAKAYRPANFPYRVLNERRPLPIPKMPLLFSTLGRFGAIIRILGSS